MRVIARPYVGEPGNFTRTSNRHDYALKPFGKTVMNTLKIVIMMLLLLVKSMTSMMEGVTEAIHKIIWMAWIS